MEFIIIDEEGKTCGLSSYTGSDSQVTVPEKVQINETEYTVTSIFSRCFLDNMKVVTVTLPSTINFIDGNAFYGCRKLEYINLPEGIERIETCTFRYNENLKEINFPSTLKYIGWCAFDGCSSLTSLIFPEGLEEIDDNAFYYCDGIEEISLPSSLKKLGEYCFGATNNIKEITFPSSIESVGEKCFYRSYYLRKITFLDGEGNVKIGENCFEVADNLQNLYIGKNLIVENNSFSSFGSLGSLIIGENVTDLSWFEPSSANQLFQLVCNAVQPPSIGRFTQDQYDNLQVFVPNENKTNYETNQNWGFFSKLFGLVLPYTDYEISVTPSDVTINVGETLNIYPNINPSINSYLYMNIDSSDVIEIVDFGIVRGVAPGKVTIVYTLLLNNKTAECEVTVVQPATSIILNKTNATLHKGETITLLANVNPYNVYDPNVTWTSTDESVATVEDGVVTAVGGGECDIVATTHNGLTAKCHINVVVFAEGISLNATDIQLKVDETYNLTVDLSPDDTTETEIIWASSDPSIVTVENGLVTAINIGEATVTAKTLNDLTAECHVTVTPVLAESIVLNLTSIEGNVGDEFELTATISPDNTTDKSVTWTSSNDEIASVYNGLVTLRSIGDAIITASTSNGLTTTCTVKVNPILVEEIIITPAYVEDVEGTCLQLSVIVLPDNATNKNIEWSVEDPNIASISSTGYLEILTAGQTIVRASAVDGSGVYADCQITGESGIESIMVDELKEWNVYSIDGILLHTKMLIKEIKCLTPDLYIISDGIKSYKISIK